MHVRSQQDFPFGEDRSGDVLRAVQFVRAEQFFPINGTSTSSRLRANFWDEPVLAAIFTDHQTGQEHVRVRLIDRSF